MNEQEEAFDSLHSTFIDLRIMVSLAKMSIPLPSWWMKIEWMNYAEQIRVFESFMDEQEFWTRYFNDPACNEKAAQRTVSIRNELRKKIISAKAARPGFYPEM